MSTSQDHRRRSSSQRGRSPRPTGTTMPPSRSAAHASWPAYRCSRVQWRTAPRPAQIIELRQAWGSSGPAAWTALPGRY